MKIRRGNIEYVLTVSELYEAHKEFVINFMREELKTQYSVSAPYAIEYAEKAYERYTEGNGETEYECIEWAARKYKEKYGKVA